MNNGKIPHPLPFGYQVSPLPVPINQFIEAVKKMLMAKGFLASTDIPLDKLHEALPLSDKTWDDLLFNQLDKQFYLLNDDFISHYEFLVKKLAQDVFDFNFLFQKQPIVRFHFPEPFPASKTTQSGWAHNLHSDLLGGHPTNMVQLWIPLVACDCSNTLQVSDRSIGKEILEALYAAESVPRTSNLLSRFARKIDEEMDFQNWVRSSCQPVLLPLGEMLVFSPYCIHGAIENREKHTRVSMDFRIIPLTEGEKNPTADWIDKYARFARGEIMHAKSAAELSIRMAKKSIN